MMRTPGFILTRTNASRGVRVSESIRFASACLSLFVAGVLLFAGVIHAAQPYLFVHTIASYRIVPAAVAGLIGVWLPYLQLVLALSIALRIAEKVVVSSQ